MAVNQGASAPFFIFWSTPKLQDVYMSMTCGIYTITNIINNKRYIGSSKHIAVRWQEHKRQLRLNDHHSPKLQRAWNKYGENNFVLSVLQECDLQDLLKMEQSAFDSLKPEYNISMVAGAPNPPPNKPIVRTDPVSGETVTFRTRAEAVASGDFNAASITGCCLGRGGTHKGYRWSFLDGSTPSFSDLSAITSVDRIAEDGRTVTYTSMSEAAAATVGCSVSGISACCLGKGRRHAGYSWRFSNNSRNNLNLLISKQTGVDGYLSAPNDFESAVFRGLETVTDREFDGEHPVDRVSFGTLEVVSYTSLHQTRADGFVPDKIWLVCNGKRNSHRGYFWKFKDREISEDESILLREKAPQQPVRKVIRKCMITGDITVFPSVAEAGRSGKFSNGNIVSCCLGQRGSHKGFYWSYADEHREFKTVKSLRGVRGVRISDGAIVEFESAAAAKAGGFNPGKVSLCCLGRRKSHNGYIWSRI